MNSLLVKTSVKENAAHLLLIHGWGMNASVWQPVRAALEAQFQLSSLDLPGYGENASIVADTLDEIVALIQPHIKQNTHLVGWSMGGLIAMAIAKAAPDKIASLSLLASTARFSQADDWPHAMSQAVLNNFAKQLGDDLEGTLKRFIALQFMGVKGAKPAQKALTQKIISHMGKSGKKGGGVLFNTLNSGLRILKDTDFRNALNNELKNIPLHWILAKRDRLIPYEVINDLKLIRPDAQITLLDDAGHAPFMTHPDEFVASLVSFINKYSKTSKKTNHA